MNDAERLEKVIKGLEKIAEFFKARGDMAVGDGKMLLLSWMRAAEDAITLLEAQEPRVMTWDELIATDHVYIETNKDGKKYIVPGIVTNVRDTAVIASVKIGTRLIDGTIYKDVYGIRCRCWTSRPTDEQRGATPWL